MISELLENHNAQNKKWFITGVAGFIGSNILETLLLNNCKVVGVDNFITGSMKNLEDVKSVVSAEQWSNFSFHEKDINERDEMLKIMEGCDFVIHQAALGSVPRSINNPQATNYNNVDGTLTIFECSKINNIKRVVYASSSSVYGDHPDLPKLEEKVGNVISPYAASKKVCEIYADAFSAVYDIEFVGLRYFNVFGKRQDPNGQYAAVIPKWIDAVKSNNTVDINGDGETSRDFTYIDNIVELNLRACLTQALPSKAIVLNGACGDQTSLNQLYKKICEYANPEHDKVNYRDFRAGDIRHSLASIQKSHDIVGYNPKINVEEGLKLTVESFK